ncbi:MAG: NADH-quinone oxidoreductase subunit J [bacterium]|nr:NADH-quinone oxidoreductase subunit J [bacterium]
MNFQDIAILFFGLLTILSATFVTFSPKILYSAFSLLFTFFGVAALYLILSADFLAATQVIVYVGGILILIIFGVLLTARITNLEILEQTQQRFIALLPIGSIGLGLILLILFTNWPINLLPNEPTTATIGKKLILTYVIAFEASSVLLIAALIGAVRLGRERNDENVQ